MQRGSRIILGIWERKANLPALGWLGIPATGKAPPDHLTRRAFLFNAPRAGFGAIPQQAIG